MNAAEHVIVLHGLVRSPSSMSRMCAALQQAGFSVANVAYPSRSGTIHDLAGKTLAAALDDEAARRAEKIHFVGHSLGAILVRDYLRHHRVEKLGRVVMLAPPNQGSEVADRLRRWRLYRWINGPAGQELGTDPAGAPQNLGEIDYAVGVIAGDRTINWINSLIIPGADDGKVSVESTRIKGMADHVVIHTAHPFIMKNRKTISQTIHFLRTGSFEKKAARGPNGALRPGQESPYGLLPSGPPTSPL